MVQKILKITSANQLGYVCVMPDRQYMQRALDLAIKGVGNVSPNPMVGCVIGYKNEIIGEGWHKKFGDAHAEANAIDTVKDKDLLTESVFYITLEPCSIIGKQPACTDLILKYMPKKVVIASKDPNPDVNGNGMRILADAGIEVIYGVMEQESITLNRRFFVSMSQNRPYLILKWAQTADSFIARKDFDSRWISNEQSRQLVHKWRTEEDAILIGYNTVKYDNPLLTARSWQGRNPVRIIVDRNLDLDITHKVFNSGEKVYLFNTKRQKSRENIHYVQVDASNFLSVMLSYLWQHNIGSVIIEGGAKTINEFLAAGYWDEARVFTAETKFGTGIEAPVITGEYDTELNINGDRLNTIYNPKTKLLWQKK